MFRVVSSKIDFPAMERQLLTWWDKNGIVKKYLSRNDQADKRFSFIDGPVTANNPLGVHHAWGRTYKDIFQRYKTMQGFKQRYQNGFDGQGLWIEVEVEKALGLNSKREIETFGIDKFVELCKERVREFADVQTRQSIRMGYWMDWDGSYHTMSDENNYMIWQFLKVCHERGLIYEGTDVMPWCPRCGTGLSQHEIVTEGYKEIVHPGLYVRFPLVESPGESLLVWTTTPWTLAANTAAYVHPELTYIKIQTEDDEILYLLKARLSEIKRKNEVIEEISGKELVGIRYRGPFDELPVQEGVDRRVVGHDEVNESEGTGIVHAAPGAGEVDFAISKAEGLSVIAPLDEFGNFIEGFDWLTGRSVFDVNDAIYDSLRDKGLFYRLDRYRHRYPVCWRCDTELVFRLVNEWFISMDELRDQIAEVATKIRWLPDFGLDRELDWLRNMDDWMISKKRYWGLALPIYKCDCGHFEVIGSEKELETKAIEGWDSFKGHSPHRPWIDEVKIKCLKCGEAVSRIRDVGNPWLDAGIVTFSTIDYRHNRDYWNDWFPADLISESFPGQFRNWFYSLLTMSTVLVKSEPTRTIHSYALLVDEKGEEMHKSKGNAIWLDDAAEKEGIDPMRWLYSRQTPSANLNFGYGAISEVQRRFLIPLWNVYSFFVTYANIDLYDPASPSPCLQDRPELDRWILSELNSLVAEVILYLDRFEQQNAARAIERFIEYLSNWYVRRSRRRFWKSGTGKDKLAAYATLYECLVKIAKLLAPFLPFMAEMMYQNLVRSVDSEVESVHLESFPVAELSQVDQDLTDATRLAMRLSSLGRAARSKAGIKVRQPIAKVLVKLRNAKEESLVERIASQVREELNVKEIAFLEESSQVASFEVRADMSKVGPKYGSATPQLLSALEAADQNYVYSHVSQGAPIEIDGFTLEPSEVLVSASAMEGYSVASDGGYTVAATTKITDDLALEGLAREMVHRVQNMRRSAGFDISDRIAIYYDGPDLIDAVATAHEEYILIETLSNKLARTRRSEAGYTEEHVMDGLEVTLVVKRV